MENTKEKTDQRHCPNSKTTQKTTAAGASIRLPFNQLVWVRLNFTNWKNDKLEKTLWIRLAYSSDGSEIATKRDDFPVSPFWGLSHLPGWWKMKLCNFHTTLHGILRHGTCMTQTDDLLLTHEERSLWSTLMKPWREVNLSNGPAWWAQLIKSSENETARDGVTAIVTANGSLYRKED